MIRLLFPNLASHLLFTLIFVFPHTSRCLIKMKKSIWKRDRCSRFKISSFPLKFMTIFSKACSAEWCRMIVTFVSLPFRAAVSSLFDPPPPPFLCVFVCNFWSRTRTLSEEMRRSAVLGHEPVTFYSLPLSIRLTVRLCEAFWESSATTSSCRIKVKKHLAHLSSY